MQPGAAGEAVNKYRRTVSAGCDSRGSLKNLGLLAGRRRVNKRRANRMDNGGRLEDVFAWIDRMTDARLGRRNARDFMDCRRESVEG